MVDTERFLTPIRRPTNIQLSEDAIMKRVGETMTDAQIKQILGEGSKIMKYAELANYKTIDELLPREKDFVILLIEDQPQHGHFCILLKYDNTVEWFNSYAYYPDRQKNMLNKAMNVMLGQNENFVTELMKNSTGYKLIYNKKRLQKLKEGINTCGRWTVLRAMCLIEMGMNLTRFLKMISDEKKQSGLPADALVAIWIA